MTRPLDVHDLHAYGTLIPCKAWQVGTCGQCGMAVMMHWSPAAMRTCPGCHGAVTVGAGRAQFSEREAERYLGAKENA